MPIGGFRITGSDKMIKIGQVMRFAVVPLAVLISAPSVSAQYFGGYGFGGGWSAPAATAGESHARGMSDVIRARSEAQQSAAIAATQFEQARRAYLENREFAARSFVEQRQLRDEFRRSGLNSFFGDKDRLATFVDTRRLQPLTSSEFDDTSGEIAWPFALSMPEDAELREELSEQFRKLASEGSLDPGERAEISRLIRQWRDDFGGRRDAFSASDFSEGARFLGRLDAQIRGNFR